MMSVSLMSTTENTERDSFNSGFGIFFRLCRSNDRGSVIMHVREDTAQTLFVEKIPIERFYVEIGSQ